MALTEAQLRGYAKLRGRRHSAETIARMAAVKMGHAVSAETRAKISAAQKGRKLSAEWLANMTAGHVGHVVTSETRAKISAANKGLKRTPEQRARISAGHMGQAPPVHTPQGLANISAAQRGRVRSAETLALMAANSSGPHTSAAQLAGAVRGGIARRGIQRKPETRAKISAKVRLAFQEGRKGVNAKHRYTGLARSLHAYLRDRQGKALEIEVRFGGYTVDLYDRAHHVAYEADGRYWHAKNEKAKPGYHARRDATLRTKYGLIVRRFDDKEIALLKQC